MLSIIAVAALQMIERELIAKEPEIEPLIVEQVKRLATILTDYIESKTEGIDNGRDVDPKSPT